MRRWTGAQQIDWGKRALNAAELLASLGRSPRWACRGLCGLGLPSVSSSIPRPHWAV